MSGDRSSSEGTSFSVGQSLGPYTISGFLGAGGMGEVYTARDDRLGREVAIKAVAAHRADPERLRRFKHEARATGQLSHPNIVAVYDVGEEGQIPYLVTELLEGRTLRARLDERRCSIDEALHLATQLCRGLAAAHGKGIVHRDLKPSNLFLLKDGHLKILDFGLAKLTHPEWEKLQTDEDTISVLSTPGTVFGSVGYMAPEQVEGGTIDHRSDIFAVGTILYEMLTGARAFREGSSVETLHAILKETPNDVQALRPEIPDALAAIVRRCLAKQASQRFQTAEDLVFALQSLHPNAERRRSFFQPLARPRFVFSAIAVALLAALALSLFSRSAESTLNLEPKSAPKPLTVTELTPSADFWSGAVSPDLRFLAYSYGSGPSNGIRLRHLASANEIDLVPPSPAIFRSATEFSLDGNYLYYAERLSREKPYELRRISLLGGDPEITVQTEEPMLGGDPLSPDQTRLGFISQDHISENRLAVMVGNPDGTSIRELASFAPQDGIADLSWSPDGRFLVIGHPPNALSELVRIDLFSGVQQPLFERPVEELSIMKIDWLSDGSGFLTTEEGTGRIIQVSYPSGEVTPLTDEAGQNRVIRLIDDRTALIRARSVLSNLWVIDPWNDRVIERITSGLDSDDGTRGLAWGSDGTIYFSARGVNGRLAIWACDSDGGNRHQITRPQAGLDHVEVQASPDGTYIVYREVAQNLTYWSHTGTSRIVKAGVDGTSPIILSSDQFAERPQITSDSEWIVYSVATGPELRHAWKVSRNGVQRMIINGEVPCWVGDVWSDDLISCTSYLGNSEFVMPVAGGPPVWAGDVPARLPFSELPPLRFSPDGAALVYPSFDRGLGQISLQPLNEKERRLLIQVPDLFANLAWSPDGQRMVVSRSSQVRRIWLAENLPIIEQPAP